MILLVGLGNPGKEYQATRHNVGTSIVEAIASHYSLSASVSKFKSHFMSGVIAEQKVIALCPQNYMNNSGVAVAEAASFYKIKPEDIYVIHDELDIDVGKIKYKFGGGAAGHNGLRSLDAHIGKDYHRIRVGIDHPGHKDKVTKYVLQPFTKDEQIIIEHVQDAIVEALPHIISGDEVKFLTSVAERMQPVLKKPEN